MSNSLRKTAEVKARTEGAGALTTSRGQEYFSLAELALCSRCWWIFDNALYRKMSLSF